MHDGRGGRMCSGDFFPVTRNLEFYSLGDPELRSQYIMLPGIFCGEFTMQSYIPFVLCAGGRRESFTPLCVFIRERITEFY